jgi:hypothetical protein
MSDSEAMISLFLDNQEENCELEFSGVLVNVNLYKIADIFWDLLNCCPDRLEIALHDIVEALPNEKGELYITRIVEKSGYTVLRLMATSSSTVVYNDLPGELAKQFWDKLAELGCESITSMASFWIVHVPPHIAPQTILDYIEEAQIPLAFVED